MSADVLSFARGCHVLRSPAAEAARQRRIKIRRVAAYRRAVDLTYTKADFALFGSLERMLIDGPGEDPRLGRPGGPSAA